MTRRFFENDKGVSLKGVGSSMTSAEPTDMEPSQAAERVRAFDPRPTLTSQQSSSLPSTPYMRPRTLSTGGRAPSPGRVAGDASPRSSHSESNQSLPSLRRHAGGCKYETGMAQARRRVPYSLGPDKLGPEQVPLKERLSDREEEKLSGDMRELYDRLLPSPESEERRKKLVEKLDKIINERWPGHTIKVNVFGSTGHKLGTTDSDVDICITTDLKEIEHVCSLAELLASHGMERVVCVSSAKVPIVKVWDPELRLACDMNVNNPIALENTEMIRTYVDIDERVKPLAMIIKYWAKRRILNEPALGSTLSSYTWICMIINFLQTRNPPILPSLQQQPNLKRRIMNGIDVTFDKDVNLYIGFGKRNQESLGQLLFQFFRYYGHELDFETKVLSLRLGKVISKSEKGWNLLQDNRLCVEEPFNTSRNLGNTADDTSMRGIHLEIRRAFKMVAEGNLEKCCEQYEYPLDEGRTYEKFTPPESRPVVASMPPPPTRGGRNGSRGGRHANSRGSNNSNRRTANYGKSVHPSLRQFPFAMSPQEVQLHQQQQQFALHDQLYQQYQYLQAQEQELRLQLHQQAFLQGRVTPSMSYPHIAFPTYTTSESGHDETNRTRAETVNHPPLTAPVRQQRFPGSSPYLSLAMPRVNGQTTNPPSPHLRSAVPDLQRTSRHASMTGPFPSSSLRAHSQPARPMPSPLSFQPVVVEDAEEGNGARVGLAQHRRPSATLSTREMLTGYLKSYRPALPLSGFGRPSEYVGYYVGHSPPMPARSRSSLVSPVPSYSGLAIQNGGLSPRLFPQIPSYHSSVVSPPAEYAETPVSASITGTVDSSEPLSISAAQQTPPRLKAKRSGPLVVNGSASTIDKQPESSIQGYDQSTGTTFSATTSEDLAFDTPTSSEDHSQGLPETIDCDLPLLSVHSHPESVERDLQSGLGALVSERRKAQETLVSDQASFSPSAARGSTKSKAKADHKPLSNGINGHIMQLQGSTQLSPVREAPNSSPNSDAHVFESPQPATNGMGKARDRNKQDKIVLQGVENQSQKDSGPSTRVNGIPPGSVSNILPNGVSPSSGWQTAKKKKHKKGAKSEGDINPANIVAGHFLPGDEALRKGG